jgi:uncharacterized protein (TIGR02246 family)
VWAGTSTRLDEKENVMSDEQAIRAVLGRLYDAWAKNDAEAFVADYAPDATSVLPGDYRPNRDIVRDRMAAAFAGRLRNSRVDDNVQSVRFYGAGTAIVISRDAVLLDGEVEVPDGRLVMATWVLTKQDGDWRIAAYHNCPA